MSYLHDAINNFGLSHSSLLDLQKSDKEYSKKIKDLMKEVGETTVNTGDYIAKITEKRSESFDEELLISILMNNGPEYCSGIIKTKQYVDMDALEDAIYNGRIDPKSLVSAKVTKITEALTVKAVKK